MMGWNNRLAQLMGPPLDTETEGERVIVDFSFRGVGPTMYEDVTTIISGDEVRRMVKSGSWVEPTSLLYKWGYYVAMGGCLSN